MKDAIIKTVTATPDLAVKRVPFELDYFANPFDPTKAAKASGTAAPTAAGTSTYILSQASTHGPEPRSSMAAGRRYNAKGLDGVTPSERMLVYEVQKIHVSAPFKLSPVTSLSTVGQTLRFDKESFRIKAELDRARDAPRPAA